MKQQFLIKKEKAEKATAPSLGFPKTSAPDDFQDSIAQQAYARYEQGDGSDGHNF